MLELDTFTIFLSWKCNYSCDHCGFSCSPHRSEKMSLEKAEKYILEASKQAGIKMIAYSGGEPFLYYDEILSLMRLASSKGLSGGIVTNCFWAVDDEIAHARLKTLKELGLKEIILSVDDYHLKYSDPIKVARVLRAAICLEIQAGINMLVTKKSVIKAENLGAILNLEDEILKDRKKVWIRESSPILAGRAKTVFDESELNYYSDEELMLNPCYFVLRNTIVTPDGSIYACCGFGGASDNGPSNITYGGNMEDQDFGITFDNLARNLFFNLMANCGPCYLLKLVEKEYPNIKYRKKFVSNCDVCDEISSNLELKEALRDVLLQMSRSERKVSL